MIDVTKLKYYKTLCEKGILDECQSEDLDEIITALGKKQFELLQRHETCRDEERKAEINEILNVVEMQLKELATIKATISSGIIAGNIDDSSQKVEEQKIGSKDNKEVFNNNLTSTNVPTKSSKRSIWVAVIGALCFLLVGAVIIMNNSNNNSANNYSVEEPEEIDEASSVNESFQNDSDSALAKENVTIIENGNYVITCGELREVLLKRLQMINLSLTDLTENNFETGGYFGFGSPQDENGEEITQALLIKVLPASATGDNSYDDVIQSYALYSTDEVDYSKLYAAAIQLAEPTISTDEVAETLSEKYNELKDNQPNDESIPINFSIFDYGKVRVYFAVDRGAQWCAITDPSMDFEKQFTDCINSYLE